MRFAHPGSIERTMVFDSNDKPGVMLSSAVRKYLNHLEAGKRPMITLVFMI